MSAPKALLAIAAGLAIGAGGAAAASAPVMGWIEIVPAGKDQISVIGHATATVATAGKFVLSLDRRSKGNSARTGQSGTFKAAAGETVVLSKTGINVVAGEDLSIELKLNVDGKDVSVTTLHPGI